MKQRLVPSDMKQLAHDVNGLMACAQLSVDRLAANQDEAAGLRAAIHLQKVIDKTVDYCQQIMTVPRHDEEALVPLQDILLSVEALLTPLARSKGIIVDCNNQSAFIRSADRDLVHRMLLNLGRNAIMATAEASGARLTFKAWGPPACLWIDVIDEGPGLGSDGLFYLSKVSGRPIERDGRPRLGLRTTHALAARMGGEVVVARTGAKGTCMRICLPRQDTNPCTAMAR